MKKIKKHDWAKVVSTLMKQYGTQKKIEEMSGIEQPTISRMLNGHYIDPSWSVGNSLLSIMKGNSNGD